MEILSQLNELYDFIPTTLGCGMIMWGVFGPNLSV